MKARTKLALKCEAVMIAIALVMLLIFLSSCTTTKVVTVEKVHTDTIRITDHQRDSIWVHDSVTVTQKGDTVLIEKWRDRYRDRQVHDTIYQSRCDSIPYPVEVTKEVPAKLSTSQRGLILIGILSLMSLVVFVAFKIKKFLP